LSKTVCPQSHWNYAEVWPAIQDVMLTYHLQVRFNVLRVLPRTGKAVKQFNKF
jgi:hypothetical protein